MRRVAGLGQALGLGRRRGGDRPLEQGQECRLPHTGQQQEAADPLLPPRLTRRGAEQGGSFPPRRPVGSPDRARRARD